LRGVVPPLVVREPHHEREARPDPLVLRFSKDERSDHVPIPAAWRQSILDSI
jgi:hypothetical protein